MFKIKQTQPKTDKDAIMLAVREINNLECIAADTMRAALAGISANTADTARLAGMALADLIRDQIEILHADQADRLPDARADTARRINALITIRMNLQDRFDDACLVAFSA